MHQNVPALVQTRTRTLAWDATRYLLCGVQPSAIPILLEDLAVMHRNLCHLNGESRCPS